MADSPLLRAGAEAGAESDVKPCLLSRISTSGAGLGTGRSAARSRQFTSVEWAYIVKHCPVCDHGTDVSESRLFSITPRRVAHGFPTVTELIARDLRISCNHEQMTGWRKYRLFGGCLWGERHPGIHSLSDPPRYPPCARDAVRSWSTQDPNFIRNFTERALGGRDRGYVRTLVLRMYDACPVDQLPAQPYPEYHRAAGPDSPRSGVHNR
jgi:hypothetical protein